MNAKRKWKVLQHSMGSCNNSQSAVKSNLYNIVTFDKYSENVYRGFLYGDGQPVAMHCFQFWIALALDCGKVLIFDITTRECILEFHPVNARRVKITQLVLMYRSDLLKRFEETGVCLQLYISGFVYDQMRGFLHHWKIVDHPKLGIRKTLLFEYPIFVSNVLRFDVSQRGLLAIHAKDSRVLHIFRDSEKLGTINLGKRVSFFSDLKVAEISDDEFTVIGTNTCAEGLVLYNIRQRRNSTMIKTSVVSEESAHIARCEPKLSKSGRLAMHTCLCDTYAPLLNSASLSESLLHKIQNSNDVWNVAIDETIGCYYNHYTKTFYAMHHDYQESVSTRMKKVYKSSRLGHHCITVKPLVSYDWLYQKSMGKIRNLKKESIPAGLFCENGVIFVVFQGLLHGKSIFRISLLV